MSYANYLIKVIGSRQAGDYSIPLTLIQERSYKGTLSTLDVNAYRDGDGVLHRDAVLQVPHVAFTTRPLTNREIASVWRNIQDRYIQAKEKKVRASVYVTELDDYVTEEFYVPDIEMTIQSIENGIVKYEPVEFEFIGYGKREQA